MKKDKLIERAKIIYGIRHSTYIFCTFSIMFPRDVKSEKWRIKAEMFLLLMCMDREQMWKRRARSVKFFRRKLNVCSFSERTYDSPLSKGRSEVMTGEVVW